MENKTKNETQKIVKWVLNSIIVAVSVFFIIMVVLMIEEVYHAVTPLYGENNFSYSVNNERYCEMVGNYYHNTLAGFEGNKTMKEYYGVAKYYEAASLYHAYTEVGNVEMAEHFLQKMEQAEGEMGGWSITKKPINQQLGME